MGPPAPRRNALVATVLTVAVIVHGSLWPYEFRVPPGSVGPVAAFLGSWAAHPSSRGDLLANVLLYAPLGLFAALALRGSAARRLGLAILAGALLSATMELLQFYDLGRTSSLWDLCSNASGAALGGLAALVLKGGWEIPFLRRVAASPVPSVLLLAMLGYRLTPYVPTIDLHKYWNALKPVVFGPLPGSGDVFQYFAIWLAASELLAAIVGPKLSLLFAPLLVGFVLAGKVVIVASVVTRAELAGAGLAVLLAWPILVRFGRGRTAVVAGVLLASVVIARLQPFAFQPVARGFGWLPFRAFLGGSLLVNTASLFEKLFLYGSLLWLLSRAGLRPWLATALVAGMLFATSLAETMLPGRSAEITDTVMALLVAGLIGLLEPPPRPLSVQPRA